MVKSEHKRDGCGKFFARFSHLLRFGKEHALVPPSQLVDNILEQVLKRCMEDAIITLPIPTDIVTFRGLASSFNIPQSTLATVSAHTYSIIHTLLMQKEKANELPEELRSKIIELTHLINLFCNYGSIRVSCIPKEENMTECIKREISDHAFILHVVSMYIMVSKEAIPSHFVEKLIPDDLLSESNVHNIRRPKQTMSMDGYYHVLDETMDYMIASGMIRTIPFNQDNRSIQCYLTHNIDKILLNIL